MHPFKRDGTRQPSSRMKHGDGGESPESTDKYPGSALQWECSVISRRKAVRKKDVLKTRARTHTNTHTHAWCHHVSVSHTVPHTCCHSSSQMCRFMRSTCKFHSSSPQRGWFCSRLLSPAIYILSNRISSFHPFLLIPPLNLEALTPPSPPTPFRSDPGGWGAGWLTRVGSAAGSSGDVSDFCWSHTVPHMNRDPARFREPSEGTRAETLTDFYFLFFRPFAGERQAAPLKLRPRARGDPVGDRYLR